MTFRLQIKCDNAAFTAGNADSQEDAQARGAEVALILRDLAKHIENGAESRRLMDSNGNNVGDCAFSN